MNTDSSRKTLISSQKKPGIQLVSALENGGAQPPRKISAVIVEMTIMLMYSARKNSAKPMPEYSIMCPATISDSPSTTSNGWRFVSATPEMKYTPNIGSSGSQFHDRMLTPMSAK